MIPAWYPLPNDVRRLIYQKLNSLDRTVLRMTYGANCKGCNVGYCIWERLKQTSAIYGDHRILLVAIKTDPKAHAAHPMGYYIWRYSAIGSHIDFMDAMYGVYECGDIDRLSTFSSQVLANKSGCFIWEDYVSILDSGKLTERVLSWLWKRGANMTATGYDMSLCHGNDAAVSFIECHYWKHVCGTSLPGYEICSRCHYGYPISELLFDTRSNPWGRETWIRLFRYASISVIQHFNAKGFANNPIDIEYYLRDCAYFPQYYNRDRVLGLVNFACKVAAVRIPNFSFLYLHAAGYTSTNRARDRDGTKIETYYNPINSEWKRDRATDWVLLRELYALGIPVGDAANIGFTHSLEIYNFTRDWFVYTEEFSIRVAKSGDLQILPELPLTRRVLAEVLLRGDDEIFGRLYAKFLSQ